MWNRLPSLAPVAPLSAELAMIHAFIAGAHARFAGRFGESRRIFGELLATLPPPSQVSVAQTYVNGLRTGSSTTLGLYAALLGDKSYERWAEEVSSVRVYTTNALLVRALGALWQGNVLESDRLESERQIRQLEHRRPQNYEGLGAVWRFMGYAACEDLTRLRLALDDVERFAARSATWESAAIWARAEYERIRGDRQAALALVDQALGRMRPGGHILWARVATTRLLILTGLGRHADAQCDGIQYLAAGAVAALDNAQVDLHLATALAFARGADAGMADEHVGAALAILGEHCAGGLRLGLAYEVAASVAIYAHDRDRYARYASRCRELYCAYDNRPLAAKYERLVRAARRAGLVARVASQAERPHSTARAIPKLESLLESCADPWTAVQGTLALIAEAAEISEAYAYALVGGSS
jgi:hypothetical protein